MEKFKELHNYNIGVYKFTNMVTGKFYIGGTSNISKRKSKHFSDLHRGVHHNTYIQSDYNKYGKNNFKFEILCYCEEDNILKVEQIVLDININSKHGLLYNICNTAGSCLGKKHSQEHKDKIGISSKKSISAYKDGIFIGDYESIKLAAEELAIHNSGISHVISGRYKKTGGYTFKLIGDQHE